MAHACRFQIVLHYQLQMLYVLPWKRRISVSEVRYVVRNVYIIILRDVRAILTELKLTFPSSRTRFRQVLLNNSACLHSKLGSFFIFSDTFFMSSIWEKGWIIINKGKTYSYVAVSVRNAFAYLHLSVPNETGNQNQTSNQAMDR